MIVAGLVLVVEPFADKLFSRTEKFEELSADFRPMMQSSAIEAYRADVRTLSSVPAALQTQLLPAIAQRAKLTPQQVQAVLGAQYPDVAAGLAVIGPLATKLTAMLDTMESQIADFEKTDAIPTKDRSTESIPWAFVAVGTVVLLAGLAYFTTGRIVPAIAVVLGVLLVAFPLVTSMTSKAPAADRLNASNKAFITEDNARSLNAAVAALRDMATEFQTKLIPEVSARFQIPAAQLAASPIVQSLTTALPAGLQRLQATADLIESNVPRYEAIRPVSFRRVTWVALGSGIAIVLAGLLGLMYSGAASVVGREQVGVAHTRAA